MQWHYMYFDCECYRDFDTGKIECFVGLLCRGEYKAFKMNELHKYVRSYREALVAQGREEDCIALICYNYNYDGFMLEHACETGSNDEQMLVFNEYLIHVKKVTEKANPQKRKYPNWHTIAFRNIDNIYLYDACEELKASDGSMSSKGSLKYWGTREGYVWRSSITKDVYEYNLSDLEATEIRFLKQGGVEDMKMKFFIIKNYLGTSYVNKQITMNLITNRYTAINKILPPKDRINIGYDLNKKEEFELFSSRFPIPWDGYIENNKCYFKDKRTGKYTHILHKYDTLLNEGGLHRGINNTIWETTASRTLYNIDFQNLYINVLCSPLVPILAKEGRAHIAKLIKQRDDAKGVPGKEAVSAATKKILVTIYGQLKKHAQYATNYVTRVSQISILWLLSRFDEDDTLCIDINTDGITISTLLSREELERIVDEFNEECGKKIHNGKAIITKIDKLYYKDVNNYLYVEDGKVTKTKGQFLINTKLQRLTATAMIDNKMEVVRKSSYNVVNYDKVISKWVETDGKEIIDSFVLEKDTDGYNRQWFDGVPFVTDLIDNPSMSSKNVKEEGDMSARDVSVSCIKGFMSHFAKSDLKRKLILESSNLDKLNKMFDEDEKKKKRSEGELFVKFNRVTDLSTVNKFNTLSSYQSLMNEEDEKEYSILLAIDTISLPTEVVPIRIVDYDLSSEQMGIREELVEMIRLDQTHILYAEWLEAPYKNHRGETKLGIHIFTTEEGYNTRFKKLYPSFQDKIYRRVTNRKSITLYKSTKSSYNVLSVGSIADVVNSLSLYEYVKQIKSKKNSTESMESGPPSVSQNGDIPDITTKTKEEIAKIRKDLESIVTSMKFLPDSYTEWLIVMSGLIRGMLQIGLMEEEILNKVTRWCLNCPVSGPKEDSLRKDTCRILGNLVLKQREGLEGVGVSLSRVKAELIGVGSIVVDEDKIVKELDIIKREIDEEYVTKITVPAFFQRKEKINILKAATGSGKTHGCVLTLVDNILKGRLFVFLTDTKSNTEEVYKKVLDCLMKNHPDTVSKLVNDGYVLSSANNVRALWEDKKYFFTTYHYFLRRAFTATPLVFFSWITSGKRKYNIYLDEVDAYLSSLEYVVYNGGRYRDSRNRNLGAKYDLQTYCPITGDRSLTAEEKIDPREVCKTCKFYTTSSLVKEDTTGQTTYAPCEFVLPYDDSQQKRHFDFAKYLSPSSDWMVNDSGFMVRTISHLVPPSLNKDPESKIIKHLVDNSILVTESKYVPTNKNKPVLDSTTEIADSYPHFSCNVSRLSGIDIFTFGSLLKYIFKTNDVSLYMFSATITKKHTTIIRKTLEAIRSSHSIDVFKCTECYEQVDQLTILFKTGRFVFDEKIASLKSLPKTLLFWPRQIDCNIVFKNCNFTNTNVVNFSGGNFYATAKNQNFEKVKFVMTYSRSTFGRGCTFDGDICVVNTAIFKPLYAYVVYSTSVSLSTEKIHEQICYTLQNVGRVIRGCGKKVIVLSKVTKAMVEYIKEELQCRSKLPIITVNVSGKDDLKIMQMCKDYLD